MSYPTSKTYYAPDYEINPLIVQYFRARWPTLSTRALNLLAGNNISSIEQLVAIPERVLIKYRNCGRKTLNELKEFLLNEGRFFQDPNEGLIGEFKAEIHRLKCELVAKDRTIDWLKREIQFLEEALNKAGNSSSPPVS